MNKQFDFPPLIQLNITSKEKIKTLKTIKFSMPEVGSRSVAASNTLTVDVVERPQHCSR